MSRVSELKEIRERERRHGPEVESRLAIEPWTIRELAADTRQSEMGIVARLKGVEGLLYRWEVDKEPLFAVDVGLPFIKWAAFCVFRSAAGWQKNPPESAFQNRLPKATHALSHERWVEVRDQLRRCFGRSMVALTVPTIVRRMGRQGFTQDEVLEGLRSFARDSQKEKEGLRERGAFSGNGYAFDFRGTFLKNRARAAEAHIRM